MATSDKAQRVTLLSLAGILVTAGIALVATSPAQASSGILLSVLGIGAGIASEVLCAYKARCEAKSKEMS